MPALWTRLLALLIAVPLASAAPEGGGPVSSTALEQVVAALRSQRDPSAPPPAELAAGLEGAARGLRPELLSILCEARVPALAEGEPQVLSEPQRELVLELLGQPPRAATLEALTAFLATHEGPAAERAALLTLGQAGRARDLDRLLAHAERAFGPEPRRGDERLVELAVTRLVQREPETLEYLVQGRDEIDEVWLPPLLDAAGASGHPLGARFVLDCVARHRDLEVHGLALLSKLVPTGDARLDEEALNVVRRRLDPSEPGACRAACQAAAELGDVESVAILIELLDGEDAGVAEVAHRALMQLARSSLPRDARMWRRWHAQEDAWRAQRQPAELVALESSEIGRVAQAISALCAHPLYRRDCEAGLAWLLASSEPVRRKLAAIAAGQLGLTSLRPALELLVADADETVRGAAKAALARMPAGPRSNAAERDR